MSCHYEIYGNELWYSIKPQRLDDYMRAKEEESSGNETETSE